jgi:hypothetical protein
MRKDKGTPRSTFLPLVLRCGLPGAVEPLPIPAAFFKKNVAGGRCTLKL